MIFRLPLLLLVPLLTLAPVTTLKGQSEEDETEAQLDEAITFERDLATLNESPWARQQTVTRIVPGIGSGEYGEKEIFSRYYVRLLSSEPIRTAYQQIYRSIEPGEIQDGTAGNSDSARAALRASQQTIIIGVAFRSNQPDLETEVSNTLRAQTLETLRNRAFLSTVRFPQLELIGYYPPREPAIGAQFVFPKQVAGKEVISEQDDSFAFELDLPGSAPRLRVTFPVSPEITGKADRPDGESVPEEAPITSEFRILHPTADGVVNLESGRFAGVVNRFPLQRRGRPIHGSVYEYHRNDNLDARNFFDPVGEPLPEYKRNQFGGSLQVELGPRINLFGSYDGLRINQGSTLVSHLPSAPMRSGDFGELLHLDQPIQLFDPDTGMPFPDNRIPFDRIHPVAHRLLPLLPSPNRGDPIRNYVNSRPAVEDRDEFTARGDIGFADSSQISGRFLLMRRDGIEAHPLPQFAVRETGRIYEGTLEYTTTFGEQTVTSWRVEFERDEDLSQAQDARPPGLLSSLGIDGVEINGPEDEGYPAFDLAGYQSFGDEGLPSHEVENSLSLEGDATFSRGDHLVHMSADLGYRQLNDSRSPALERGAFGFTGIFSGDSFADMLLGRAERATRAIGSSRQDLRRTSLRFGLRDEWRVHPQLTITAGLEWGYFGPYRSIRNNVSVFRPLLFEPPEDGELIDLGRQREDGGITPVQADWNNFSPWIGAAFRPFGNSRTVLRVSYSVDHDPLPSWIFENYMGRNFPYYYIQHALASSESGGLDLGMPFNTDIPTELTIRDIAPDIGTPYSQAWTLALENEFTDQWSLDASLRLHRSLHDFRFLPANVPQPAAGPVQPRRPNPDFGAFTIVTGGGSSLFYEAQIDLLRRFSDGFTFSGTFEVRRRFDDDFDEVPSNPRNLAAEWAPSSGFPSRRFRLNFIVELPFGKGRPLGGIPVLDALLGGFRLSGIGRIYSGTPFTVQVPGDPNNDGLSADRPDRTGPAELSGDARTIDRWFDTTAFASPPSFGFGNAGRNILLGPSFHNWDFNLVKEFLFSSSQRLQLRLALFNALNHANFERPGTIFGTRPFGVVSAAGRAREIEVALKYFF